MVLPFQMGGGGSAALCPAKSPQNPVAGWRGFHSGNLGLPPLQHSSTLDVAEQSRRPIASVLIFDDFDFWWFWWYDYDDDDDGGGGDGCGVGSSGDHDEDVDEDYGNDVDEDEDDDDDGGSPVYLWLLLKWIRSALSPCPLFLSLMNLLTYIMNHDVSLWAQWTFYRDEDEDEEDEGNDVDDDEYKDEDDEDNESKDDAFSKLKQTFIRDPVLIYLMQLLQRLITLN